MMDVKSWAVGALLLGWWLRRILDVPPSGEVAAQG